MANVIKKINTGGTTYPIDRTFTLTGLSTVDGNGSSGSYLSVRWYCSGVEGLTTPYDGMRLMIKIPKIGVSTAGAMLSINGNTASEYHPLAYNKNSVLTSHYAVDTYKIFVYDASATMTVYKTSNTSSTVTGVWKAEANYDSDSDTKVAQNYSTTNNNYPILATATSGISSTSNRGNTTSILNNGVYMNPSSGYMYAKGLGIYDAASGYEENALISVSGATFTVYETGQASHFSVGWEGKTIQMGDGSNTYTYTFPSSTGTVALTGINNDFTASQTFEATITVEDADATTTIGMSFISGSYDDGDFTSRFEIYALDDMAYVFLQDPGGNYITFSPTQIEKGNLTYTYPSASGQLLAAPDPASNKDKYLHTNSSTGALEWASVSGGGSGVTEISTQYIRIWDLATGVYKLTYNGTKYLYYNGSASTSTHTVTGGTGAVILVVNTRTTTYKHWYYINGTNSYATLYFGYTSSTAGYVNSKALSNLLTSHRTLYQHNIYAAIYWKSAGEPMTYLHTTIINSSSTAYTASTFASYIYTNFPNGTTVYHPTVTCSPIASHAQDSYYGYVVGIVGMSSTYFDLLYSAIDSPSSGGGFYVFTTSSSAGNDDAYISYFTDKVVSI